MSPVASGSRARHPVAAAAHREPALAGPTAVGQARAGVTSRPALFARAGMRAGPAYFENRKRGLPQLFFNSLRPGSALNDIYVADAFGSAMPVNELNSTGTDADPSITADGLEIFFHSNRPGSAGTDMYSSVRKSVLEPWSQPEPLGPVVNTGASENLGAISPDGDTLFFTSTRDGGFGSNDIYTTTRRKHGRR
jgi:hypothetical protein